MKTVNKQCIILILILIAITSFAFAQDKTLVGKVTTFDSIPLIGVDVLVKSTKQSFKTDSLGRFQVFCDPEDRLEISAKGFYSQKVKVEKEIRMILVNLKLKKGDNNLEMAGRYVNVGYGYVSSKDLLYAVSSANTNDIDFTKYDSVLDAIQGQFPGVMVENGEVIIRGVTTFYGSQGNAALVVIDGAITSTSDLENMSPHDVQSIDILKDGSSSVYGSRGANGVVIVETKKGK
jgi:TonB-dependent SusC/RagA subfamily outer membrane receptor